MASDETTGTPKRRGKSPVITLTASEVPMEPVPTAAEAAIAPAETPAEAPADPVPVAAEIVSPSTFDDVPPPAAPAEPVLATADAEGAPPAPEAVIPAPEPAPQPAPAPVMMAPEPAPASGPGFGSLAAAGLIGALLTGAAGYGALVGGFIGSPVSNGNPALERRIADLDKLVREQAARPAAPATSPAATPSVDLGPLTARLGALDTARADLDKRLAALETRPAATAGGPAAAPVDLMPLQTLVATLRDEVTALKGAAGVASGTAGDAGAAAVELEGRVAAATAALGARITTLQSDLVKLETAQGAASTLAREGAAKAEALAAQIQAIAPRLAAAETAGGENAQAGRRAALALAAESLRGAMARGSAYTAELAAIRGLGASAETLAALSGHAQAGLPTTAVLSRRFTELAPALLRALPQSSAPGMLDRLTANVQNLVRVRPVGEAAGDDPTIVIARVEAKLARGDLAGAIADTERLPDAAKTLAKPWLDQARARLDADRAVSRLSADALGAIAAPR
ncbi:MAG: mitofilin family membrane protein [Alphaproteobacteria bacterium]